MSVQFGRWSFDGEPPEPGYLEKAAGMLAPYGPDGGGVYSAPGIDILYRAFHTTKESRREHQPLATPSGSVITWDGRLDNREELVRELRFGPSSEIADVSIVASVYERWGEGCFARLLGDWACAVWKPSDHILLLAKDPIGIRPLYYSVGQAQATWSTVLEPLVLLAGRTLPLDEEYIAGWLSFFPAAHHTPYAGIHSVPPSNLVRIAHASELTRKHWDFDPSKRIHHRADAEYEEHFRSVFAESVRRRLHSDSPVLAELSGGMDSSAIVCMADSLIRRGPTEVPRLDTFSCFNDHEPNWNERPFFAAVEEKRGRSGLHIDASSVQAVQLAFDDDRLALTPASGGHSAAGDILATSMVAQGYRVVLSGVGGDEVTGGVPSPLPQLADLLAAARLRALAHQLKLWALEERRPWFHLLLEAARGFVPVNLVGAPKRMRPAGWLERKFQNRYREALAGYPRRLKLFGPLPSFQENVKALEGLKRQIACAVLPSDPPAEKRYPFLDRDLLEFLLGLPSEQQLRPGYRRSLMRRALRGIVPDEILERRRKAFLARSPLLRISEERHVLLERVRVHLNSLGKIVDDVQLERMLDRIGVDASSPSVPLLRLLLLTAWLEKLRKWMIPRLPAVGCAVESNDRDPRMSVALQFEIPRFSAEKISQGRG